MRASLLEIYAQTIEDDLGLDHDSHIRLVFPDHSDIDNFSYSTSLESGSSTQWDVYLGVGSFVFGSTERMVGDGVSFCCYFLFAFATVIASVHLVIAHFLY